MGAVAVAPRRPVMRYHGGKWRMAPWVIAHFPPHRIYVEPFGGAGSVLMRKPRSATEVFNDLHDDVVTLFRVLRDPKLAAELRLLCELTPYSRKEHDLCQDGSGCNDVERARRLVVRSAMGFGSRAATSPHKTGFRANTSANGSTPAMDWAKWPAQVAAITERLQGVTVECRPAIRVIEQYDKPDTLHYVDPPYPWRTRSKKSNRDAGGAYRHEMDDEAHRELASVLRKVSGAVVLSGYPCDLYDDLYPGWTCVTKATLADQGAKRTEAIWLNPVAERAVMSAGLFHATQGGE